MADEATKPVEPTEVPSKPEPVVTPEPKPGVVSIPEHELKGLRKGMTEAQQTAKALKDELAAIKANNTQQQQEALDAENLQKLLDSMPGDEDVAKAMFAQTKTLKDEIAKLQKRDNDRDMVLRGMAREMTMTKAESAMKSANFKPKGALRAKFKQDIVNAATYRAQTEGIALEDALSEEAVKATRMLEEYGAEALKTHTGTGSTDTPAAPGNEPVVPSGGSTPAPTPPAPNDVSKLTPDESVGHYTKLWEQRRARKD